MHLPLLHLTLLSLSSLSLAALEAGTTTPAASAAPTTTTTSTSTYTLTRTVVQAGQTETLTSTMLSNSSIPLSTISSTLSSAPSQGLYSQTTVTALATGAPYPVTGGNATTPLGSASASGPISKPTTSPPVVPFKGAAGRVDGANVGIFVAVGAGLLVLV